jgi:transposase-like protein
MGLWPVKSVLNGGILKKRLLTVRWYLSYALSYRNIEEMMAERQLFVDHSTVNRWVLHYAPLLEAGPVV